MMFHLVLNTVSVLTEIFNIKLQNGGNWWATSKQPNGLYLETFRLHYDLLLKLLRSLISYEELLENSSLRGQA